MIVLGDFNTTRNTGGTDQPFRDRGWRVAVDEPTNLGGSEVLDNVVFDPGPVREWSGPGGRGAV